MALPVIPDTNPFTIVPLDLLACGCATLLLGWDHAAAALQSGWRTDLVLAVRARRGRRRAAQIL